MILPECSLDSRNDGHGAASKQEGPKAQRFGARLTLYLGNASLVNPEPTAAEPTAPSHVALACSEGQGKMGT